MTTEIRKICDRLEKHLAWCIRDDLNRGGWLEFYITTSSECRDLKIHSAIAAMTCTDIVECLRPAIGTRWRGRGVGMLIVESERLTDEMITAFAIHETAHIVEELMPQKATAKLRSMASQDCRPIRQQLTETLTKHPRTWAYHRRGKDEGHSGHGIEFARIVLHLAYRMAGRGWDVRPGLMFNWRGAWKPYFEAIEAECQSREFHSLVEIATSSIPEEFTSVWDADHKPNADIAEAMLATA